MKKEIFSGIDVGKLIAAVLVVLLHAVETTAWLPAGVKYVLTRFAVPFFFMASGFFFYRGLSAAEDAGAYFRKYELHLLKVLLVWETLYFPFTLKEYLLKYAGESALKLCVLLIRRLVIIGAGPYWYLIALIWASAFLYFCYRRQSDALLVTGVLLGIGLEIAYACFQGVLSSFAVFRALFRLIYGVFSFEFNFLTFGIPFMGCGYLLAKRQISWPAGRAALVFCLATVLRVLEYNLPRLFPGGFWENNTLSLAFIPQAISFFFLMKAWKLRISREASLGLRQLSSSIYYTHVFFLYELLNPLLDRYTALPTYAGVMVFPKVVVTLLMCTAFFLIVKKIDNKHLNILING